MCRRPLPRTDRRLRFFTEHYPDLDFPKQLLVDCVRLNAMQGSSTFVIASISNFFNSLQVAFLGDSGRAGNAGVIVLRPKTQEEKARYKAPALPEPALESEAPEGLEAQYRAVAEFEQWVAQHGTPNFKVVLRSQSQEHDFNFPFQVGTHGDDPSAAEEYSLELGPRDLVILGTDGLFDNVYDFQVLQTAEALHSSSRLSPKQLADSLTQMAFEHSQNKAFLSPFCNAKLRQLGKTCLGGKPDDITVSLGEVHGKFDLPPGLRRPDFPS